MLLVVEEYLNVAYGGVAEGCSKRAIPALREEMDAQCLEPPRFTKNVVQSSPRGSKFQSMGHRLGFALFRILEMKQSP